jgi:molybdopterin converting factor subunit 1
MKITILLFAHLRDFVGAKTIEMEVPAELNVARLKELLVSAYPGMLQAQNSMLTAINGEYASDQQLIPLNAEIALFPPVSGG